MKKKKLVVLTGAGISAESGIATFRDANGLWEGHDVMEVASPEGWRKNPALVLDFYNQRRKNAHLAKPNPGHLALAELEKKIRCDYYYPKCGPPARTSGLNQDNSLARQFIRVAQHRRREVGLPH